MNNVKIIIITFALIIPNITLAFEADDVYRITKFAGKRLLGPITMIKRATKTVYNSCKDNHCTNKMTMEQGVGIVGEIMKGQYEYAKETAHDTKEFVNHYAK